MADFKPSGIRVSSIVGNLTRDPESKFNGDLVEVSVAVDHGRKIDGAWSKTGTTFVTYAANGEYAEPLLALAKGDRVEIEDAALETRTYEKNDGGTGVQVTARFGSLTVLERAADRPTKGAGDPAWSGKGFD